MQRQVRAFASLSFPSKDDPIEYWSCRIAITACRHQFIYAKGLSESKPKHTITSTLSCWDLLADVHSSKASSRRVAIPPALQQHHREHVGRPSIGAHARSGLSPQPNSSSRQCRTDQHARPFINPEERAATSTRTRKAGERIGKGGLFQAQVLHRLRQQQQSV